MVYRIYSRISTAFRWRLVRHRPHGECYPFDAKGLYFATEAEAKRARDDMARANGAQFLIIPDED